jgi:hypothetical protein
MPRPFIPAPNCASIELIYAIPQAVAENIIHVQKGSPYSAGDLAALRTLIDNWDNTSWKTTRHAAASLSRIRTKALDSVGSAIEDYALPVPRVGTSGAASLPNNVTACIKLATGKTGRSFRGRLYVVGVGVSNLITGSQSLTGTYAAAVLNSLTTLKTNLLAAGHTLGVLSYRANGAWRSTALFTPATGWVWADVICDSRRNRLPGRGI